MEPTEAHNGGEASRCTSRDPALFPTLPRCGGRTCSACRRAGDQPNAGRKDSGEQPIRAGAQQRNDTAGSALQPRHRHEAAFAQCGAKLWTFGFARWQRDPAIQRHVPTAPNWQTTPRDDGRITEPAECFAKGCGRAVRRSNGRGTRDVGNGRGHLHAEPCRQPQIGGQLPYANRRSFSQRVVRSHGTVIWCVAIFRNEPSADKKTAVIEPVCQHTSPAWEVGVASTRSCLARGLMRGQQRHQYGQRKDCLLHFPLRRFTSGSSVTEDGTRSESASEMN